MSTPRPCPLTIESIDAELRAGFRDLLFERNLERQFQIDMMLRTKRHLLVASIAGLVFYDLFLINDWVMVHDVFSIAMILRFAIFTPLALCGIAVLLNVPWSLAAMEKIASSLAFIAVAFIMTLYSLSNSVYREAYQYGPMMVMVFLIVFQRVRVRYCFPTLAAVILIQVTATWLSPALDATIVQGICTIYATVTILVLFAAYGFEHERRRSYLLSIRSGLMNDQLERSGKIDPLTGLWNRRHLNAIMTSAWLEAEGAPQTMSVILLDIDHFKLFNDTYGHLEGDVCLQRVGASIRKALDHRGDVVRFGGEEFLVFMAVTDAESALKAAHLLRDAIHAAAIPYPVLGAERIVTASIGVATGLAPNVSAAEIMSGADSALYDAKHSGRDLIRTLELVELPSETSLPERCAA